MSSTHVSVPKFKIHGESNLDRTKYDDLGRSTSYKSWLSRELELQNGVDDHELGKVRFYVTTLWTVIHIPNNSFLIVAI